MTKTILAIAAALGIASAAWAQQKQPKVKSRKEAEAYNAMVTAPTPDARIQAAEDFLTKFADSDFKEMALQTETLAYQQKNDFDNMVIFGERTLEVDPDNIEVLVALARGIAQRTREHDLDRDEKLARAEKYAKRAQTLIPNWSKPNPQIPDEQWTEFKKDRMAQAHAALGQIAFVRKDFANAEQSFKAGVDVAPQPDPVLLYQLGMVYGAEAKYDEGIATMDKAIAAGGVKVGGRDLAAEQKANFEKAKASAASKSSAAPGSPPQPKQQ